MMYFGLWRAFTFNDAAVRQQGAGFVSISFVWIYGLVLKLRCRFVWPSFHMRGCPQSPGYELARPALLVLYLSRSCDNMPRAPPRHALS